MAILEWDQSGKKFYETGVEQGVLYEKTESGTFTNGVVWNGLSSVTESPSGAEATPIYADNKKYLELRSAEDIGGTIEAYQSPVEFDACDGTATLGGVKGVSVRQQTRKPFGLSYITKIGNDIDGDKKGEKIHLIYNATASPSERQYQTINDSPEAMTLSWEFTTVPVEVTINGEKYKPTSVLVVNTTEANAAGVAKLKEALHGTASEDPYLPLPSEVYNMFNTNNVG